MDFTRKRITAAYVAPMAVFLGFLALNSLLKSVGTGFWLESAEFWIYPLQTVVCGAVLLFYKSEYAIALPRRIWIATVVGVVVFVIWISPQAFFGATARTSGYNPEIFADRLPLYWTNVVFRFARLVIVVPLIEEIFWRGFLLRYLISNDFVRVPFGSFSWPSFAVVAIAFMLTHALPDWPAALICGVLYNCVAYWTKSLTSCVVAHAATNLFLGLWIMQTRQWGFW
ncbi:MAG: CAAX prenyl protease-related protein [Chthoniobacterales bacterium]